MAFTRKEVVHNYYIRHKEECLSRSKEWAIKNAEKMKQIRKKERIKHQDKYREYKNQYCKKRYNEDPIFRLNHNICTGINSSLRNRKNGIHWESLVGYNLKELKNHLEKHFSPQMEWENYGEWHIDHQIPISAFNFRSYQDIDFKRCWALKNLKPMWATQNLKKHNKLTKPFQPFLAFG